MFRNPRGRLPRLTLYTLLAVFLALWAAFALQTPAAQAALPHQITSTPMPDGAIVHIVQDGENLAGISEMYGVSMDDIRGFNGMAPTSNLIFPGQSLIIRLPLPPTETPTITPSVPRPTRTPTLVTPSRTPRPTRTITPTLVPSATTNPAAAAVSTFYASNQRLLLIGMLVLCALGLGWTLWSGFRPSRMK